MYLHRSQQVEKYFLNKCNEKKEQTSTALGLFCDVIFKQLTFFAACEAGPNWGFLYLARDIMFQSHMKMGINFMTEY